MPRQKVSACVVTYNRADVIGTTLAPLAFADEVIVVDKSSTDATPEIARRHADRVIRVPWSPTVEETRRLAVEHCRHDWIILLDDDECFSAEAILFMDAELRAPRADIYRFPLRHYVLGRHDERAYYWPEAHVRLFNRSAVEFLPTVHAGMRFRSERTMDVPLESGACIHHLSHVDAAQWVEKTNRYTSRRDRAKPDPGDAGMIAFAHAAIDRWAARGRGDGGDGYLEAVALLRAVYDIVDRVKLWEEATGKDGTILFAETCRTLEAEYAASLARFARPLQGGMSATRQPGFLDRILGRVRRR